MTYWSNNQQGAIDYQGLIEFGNGNCQAWASLCTATLTLHAVTAAIATMYPRYNLQAFGLGYPDPDFPGQRIAGKYLTLSALPAQGNPTPPIEYDKHAGVIYKTVTSSQNFFDPSFGLGPFIPHSAWENAVLCFVTAERVGVADALVYITNTEASLETHISPVFLP